MEEEEGVIAKSKEEIEQDISRAMRSRLSDFKEKADSLTLEGVRRTLEKDLGMRMFSLDAHKRFIRQNVEECFYGANDENQSKSTEVEASRPVREELIQSEIIHQPEKSKDSNSDKKEAEGVSSLAKEEPDNKEIEVSECSEVQNSQNEDRIMEAIKKRAAYFRTNTEHITLKDVRRTLEDDLKLEKNALDAYKSLVAEELDKVLCPPEVVKSSIGVKKTPKKVSQKVEEGKNGKGSKRAHEESDYSETDNSASENEEEDPRPKKNAAKKTKGNATGPKRQRKSADENKSSFSKPKKPSELPDESGSSSEDGHSDSSPEEQIEKKRERPTQVYDKKVEHLKSVIKSCGMGIPPSIYKKVKQAPESKREAYLIKELEEILRKEGLSNNPSEKEIKAVRKRKERAKELEGIDMSNIVPSSRRRTTSSYIPPPKPKIEDEEDGDEDEEDEEDEEGEDDGEDTDDGDGGDSDSNEASNDGVMIECDEDESD